MGAWGGLGSCGNFGSLTRVNKIPAKRPFSHVKTPFTRFQSRRLSQNSQDSQSSQGSQENAGYVSVARVCVSAAIGASGDLSAAGGVRWNRAHCISIRVTGPIAKCESLRAHKRARSGGSEAASRVHNALRLRDAPTVVGIIHTRLSSRGDASRRCCEA